MWTFKSTRRHIWKTNSRKKKKHRYTRPSQNLNGFEPNLCSWRSGEREGSQAEKNPAMGNVEHIDMKHRRINATFEIPRTTYFSAFVPNPKRFNTHHNTKDALHRCCIHLGECENGTTYQLIFLTTQPKNEESKITTCSIHEAWNDERQTLQLSTRPGQREPNNAIVAMHKQSRQNLGKQNSNLHCKSTWRGQIRNWPTSFSFLSGLQHPRGTHTRGFQTGKKNTNTVIRKMCSGCWKLR